MGASGRGGSSAAAVLAKGRVPLQFNVLTSRAIGAECLLFAYRLASLNPNEIRTQDENNLQTGQVHQETSYIDILYFQGLN